MLSGTLRVLNASESLISSVLGLRVPIPALCFVYLALILLEVSISSTGWVDDPGEGDGLFTGGGLVTGSDTVNFQSWEKAGGKTKPKGIH